METINLKKAIAEEETLTKKHEKDMHEMAEKLIEVKSNGSYQEYLELKAKRFTLQNKQNMEKNKFYSGLQNSCTHPIIITGSPDTNWSHAKDDPTCFCLTCFKAFDIPSHDLKLYYDEKRLIAEKTISTCNENTFKYTKLYNEKGLTYIRNLYSKIIDIMEEMQGPCLPEPEDVLFDYIVNEEGPKTFTKLYNNVK